MADDGLNRIKRLFTEALAMPPAEREAWLRAECAGSATLCDKVMRMLKTHDDDTGFLEIPPISLNESMAPTEEAPESIGAYRILHQIGEGGMGVVYLAEQSQPIRRRVALKLIKLGMDTKSVVARFNAERQTLALLDHRNVARVLEAGATDTGRPYFVMEYVAGEPITRFCDAHNLTLDERLALFVDVCHALQHAHQKGIIHRDIKPSNVLVAREDGVPVPKVIDFGVAKATDQRLTEHTLFTEHGLMIGTPSYMSPEQAELSAIGVDARTDVYSLGVLLYEMIVGVLPFEPETLRRAGYAEIQRIIRDVEPSKPSTRFKSLGADTGAICEQRRIDRHAMHRLLSGDLDWITMKAIDKDPARRYPSASELAADIQRHLRDEPVTASPPSNTYKMRKFVRRHRGAVAAGALVLLALITGVIGVSIGWSRARLAEHEAAAQAVEASRQAEIATAVNDFLNNDLLAAVKPSVEKGRGRDVLMRDVLYAAAEHIETAGAPGGRFADKPMIEAAIRETLGVTLLYLGDYDAAEPHLTRARDLTTRFKGEESLEAIRAIDNLSNLYQNAGRESEAESLQRQALDAATKVLGPDHPQTLVAKNNLATIYHLRGRYAESASLFSELLTARRRILGETSRDTINAASNLAIACARDNKLDQAESLLREWLPIARKALPDGDPSIAYFLKNLGETLARKGQVPEARSLMTEALEIRKRVVGAEHPDTLTSMHDLAILSSVEGRHADAARLFEQVANLRRKVLGEAHSETISAMSNLANTYISLNRGDDAERLLKENLDIAERQYGSDHIITMRVMYLLGWLYLQQDRLDESEDINGRLLQAQRQLLGPEHSQTLGTLESVASTQFRRKRYSESQGNYLDLLEILRRTLGASNPATCRIMENLAEVYVAQNRMDEARSILSERLRIAREIADGDAATASQKLLCARLLLNATPEDLRDPQAALALADTACGMSEAPNAQALSILALAQFRTGDVTSAMDTQRLAIDRLDDDTPPPLRDRYLEQLKLFQAPPEGE